MTALRRRRPGVRAGPPLPGPALLLRYARFRPRPATRLSGRGGASEVRHTPASRATRHGPGDLNALQACTWCRDGVDPRQSVRTGARESLPRSLRRIVPSAAPNSPLEARRLPSQALRRMPRVALRVRLRRSARPFFRLIVPRQNGAPQRHFTSSTSGSNW